MPVPEAAPPYDEGRPPAERGVSHRPDRPATPGPARPAGQPPLPARPAASDRARPVGAVVTDAWPSQFAQILAETLAGSRPPGQIASWTTEQTRKRISQLGPLLSATHRPRVRKVLVTSPAPDVLEMTVVVGLGTRVRAVAVRLERTRPTRPARTAGSPTGPGQDGGAARWICTAVEAA